MTFPRRFVGNPPRSIMLTYRALQAFSTVPSRRVLRLADRDDEGSDFYDPTWVLGPLPVSLWRRADTPARLVHASVVVSLDAECAATTSCDDRAQRTPTALASCDRSHVVAAVSPVHDPARACPGQDPRVRGPTFRWRARMRLRIRLRHSVWDALSRRSCELVVAS